MSYVLIVFILIIPLLNYTIPLKIKPSSETSLYHTARFQNNCDYNYVRLLEVHKTFMSLIEREYILNQLNSYRNDVAMGVNKNAGPGKNLGVLQYDIELEYIATCVLRESEIVPHEIELVIDSGWKKFVVWWDLFDFQDEAITFIHFAQVDFHPFDMRKTLLKRAMELWVSEEDFVEEVVHLLMYHQFRAVGCSKFISAKFRPMYLYEFACIFRPGVGDSKSAQFLETKMFEHGRPHENEGSPYPGLMYDYYVVPKFKAPLNDVVHGSAGKLSIDPDKMWSFLFFLRIFIIMGVW